MKKAFTIIELLISIVIFGILIAVLFKLYLTMLDLSVRIENEKILNNDVLYFSQVTQNFIDKGLNIDYGKYLDNGTSYLTGSYGFTGALHLTGGVGPIMIYSTGDCNDFTGKLEINNNCWIEMNNSGTIVELTDKDKTYFTKVLFQIIPGAEKSDFNLDYEHIYSDGFGLYTQGYIKKYNPKRWIYNVNMFYQNFYNIRAN
ncbi:MAG: type II secretion system protein [Candidatus Absconditabacteria bacterium]